MALFENLALFCDECPRDAFAQMALDEALLESAAEPVLRVYRWAGPATSFGYSQSLVAVRSAHPVGQLVRRWTGGGVVPHQGDWTFALVCPASDRVAALRPRETYHFIHEAILRAVREEGIPARLVAEHEVITGPACFAAPALHDIFSPEGDKICGGAQRRTRHGFLHQGSLQLPRVSPGFAPALAAHLARNVRRFCPGETLEVRAAALALSRYGTTSWLEKIP